MNCYFEEGEVFTWIRDRERTVRRKYGRIFKNVKRMSPHRK